MPRRSEDRDIGTVARFLRTGMSLLCGGMMTRKSIAVKWWL
jgi:hypothetical protein